MSKLIFVIFSLFAVISSNNITRKNFVILESPNITNRGDWGDLVSCSNDPFKLVVGFQLRVDFRDPYNEDNTALDGIFLACGDPNSRNISKDKLKLQSKWISSSLGPNGTFGFFQQQIICNSEAGYVVGFQLKSQQDQGPHGDDVGAVNLKMICADGEEIEGYDEGQNSHPDSEYTEALKCPEGFGVCGIQTQEEDFKWEGDNTAVNNIRIKCCRLPESELGSTTIEYYDEDGAAETVISGKDGPLPQRVRLFENLEGVGTNETIVITSRQCNPMPENWIGRVGSLEYKADCVRIWENTDCSGHTRCHCDEGFASFDETMPMSENITSWNGNVKGLGMCQVENDNFTSFRIFSEYDFHGVNEYMVMVPDQCMTLYQGDKWRGKVASIMVVYGCVELFDTEECSGYARNKTLANDYDASAQIFNFEVLKAFRNCGTQTIKQNDNNSNDSLYMQ